MEIAICDDNKLFILELEQQLHALAMPLAISTFSNYDAFLLTVEEGRQYNVILMDIEWDERRNGMDIAEELYKLSPSTKIIFITGHGALFSQRIFLRKTNLSGFLTKPIDIKLLQANLQKVSDALVHDEQSALVLRQRGAPVSILHREIVYIESSGHTIEVHTVSETVTVYERLEQILAQLPLGFYQCHKSFVVNMAQIRRFESTDILLKNGERVPISRARYAQTKDAYFAYMGQSF